MTAEQYALAVDEFKEYWWSVASLKKGKKTRWDLTFKNSLNTTAARWRTHWNRSNMIKPSEGKSEFAKYLERKGT